MEAVRALLLALFVWLRLAPKPELVMRKIANHPLPEQMEGGVVYVVGGRGFQKWAYLLCPTGSGEVIQLSLQPNHKPRWSVSADFLGRPTIYPSVRQLAGSYAHFWVRSGNILWCEDSGQRLMFERRTWQA